MLHATIAHRLLVDMLCLVTPSRIGIVVYPRVSSELIGTRESLCAARELTGVRLLARVRSNVSGLMLETVEGLIAERTLVRTWEILSVLAMLTPNHRGHHADGCHLCFVLFPLDLGQFPPRSFLISLYGGLWIQQTRKIYCRRSALHVIAAAAIVEFPCGNLR